MGAIDLKAMASPVESMVFSQDHTDVNVVDLNDEQDRMLNQEFQTNMTLSSHRSNLLDATDNLALPSNDT